MAIVPTVITQYQCNICFLSYSAPIAVCINASDAQHQAVEPTVTYDPNVVAAPPDAPADDS